MTLKILGVYYWYIKMPRCGCVEHGLEYFSFYIQKHIAHLAACSGPHAGLRPAAGGARISEISLLICIISKAYQFPLFIILPLTNSVVLPFPVDANFTLFSLYGTSLFKKSSISLISLYQKNLENGSLTLQTLHHHTVCTPKAIQKPIYVSLFNIFNNLHTRCSIEIYPNRPQTAKGIYE